MTETPNPQQRELIESTEGFYLVDAGAGTGKTFAVTRRYAEIVEQAGVDPDDILLATFTRSAATEMKDRILAHCDYRMRDLADAPIQTFHSLSHDILQAHGLDAPEYLGIDDRLTPSMRIIEDETVERAFFGEFIDQFTDAHPEHHDLLRAVRDPASLLDLITNLASRGAFPTADGWYRNGGRYLDGDYATFKTAFDQRNQTEGNRQSALRAKLNDYGKNKIYLPDAPSKDAIRGPGEQVPEDIARTAFDEDRTELKQFVHDVYYEYLQFALRRNYLNYSFLQLFAFVLLCEDHTLRKELSFEYLMVDEFQDSSEIQFKLALLLAKTNNLCVVGDWKQSIYSFQYAAVENIQYFEQRLERFKAELNADTRRVDLETEPIATIELVENYRSTQAILDFAEQGLTTPAMNKDSVDVDAIQERIVSLSANATYENSQIEAIQSDQECETVLGKIQQIVGNTDYSVEEDGALRPPTYGDVAVLTRTHDFGRELVSTAREYDLPVAYEGGIELLRTDQAKLLLAWLRILESDADRGWALVLEEAGYTLDEMQTMLESASYPEEMQDFKEELAGLVSVGGIAQRVFSRYGYDGTHADVVLHTIQSVHRTTTMTRGDLIRFLERGIEAGSKHDVTATAGTDAVTVQTIHAVKGLEHPIVILANMNRHKFPSSGRSDGTITYRKETGLRQRKLYAEAHGYPYLYDNWQADVLRMTLPQDYDEERRLLYVAMTRAKKHLILTAGETPNSFIENLPVDLNPISIEPTPSTHEETEASPLEVSVTTPEGPIGLTPHSLMDETVFEDVQNGRGTEFGSSVHDVAERYVLGHEVEPTNDDEQCLIAFLESLTGELQAEQEAYLPLSVDSQRVTISGIIDLVHVTPDMVEIIDYKTDRGRHAESEYRKQLSVYYQVVSSQYPDRDVSISIFYTDTGQQVTLWPLSTDELTTLIREREIELS